MPVCKSCNRFFIVCKVTKQVNFIEDKDYKNIKIQLFGKGIILLGIAVSTNNFFSYAGGIIGLVIMAVGCFGIKDK